MCEGKGGEKKGFYHEGAQRSSANILEVYPNLWGPLAPSRALLYRCFAQSFDLSVGKRNNLANPLPLRAAFPQTHTWIQQATYS